MTIAVEPASKTVADLEQMAKPSLKVGIPKEIYPGEQRVAATPATAQVLQKMGFEVWIEPGAGDLANFSDDSYQQAGCHICSDVRQLWAIADIVLKVRAPQQHPDLGIHEAELVRADQTLISFIWPAQKAEMLNQLADRHGLHPPHHAGAKNGCPEFHGKPRRLSRHSRSRPSVWSLFYRTNYRRW
jgi:H+-translocating NAD(P) transhydrogenase subunit alpha